MRAAETIRLLLSSRNSIARQGVRKLLSHDASIQIVGEVKRPLEVVSESMRLNPDFVLMDVDMTRSVALDLIRRMRQAKQGMGILLFSTWNEPDHIEQCLLAGANDYMPDTASSAELLRMLHSKSDFRRRILPRTTRGSGRQNGAALLASQDYPLQIEIRKKR